MPRSLEQRCRDWFAKPAHTPKQQDQRREEAWTLIEELLAALAEAEAR